MLPREALSMNASLCILQDFCVKLLAPLIQKPYGEAQQISKVNLIMQEPCHGTPCIPPTMRCRTRRLPSARVCLRDCTHASGSCDYGSGVWSTGMYEHLASSVSAQKHELLCSPVRSFAEGCLTHSQSAILYHISTLHSCRC